MLAGVPWSCLQVFAGVHASCLQVCTWSRPADGQQRVYMHVSYHDEHKLAKAKGAAFDWHSRKAKGAAFEEWFLPEARQSHVSMFAQVLPVVALATPTLQLKYAKIAFESQRSTNEISV